MELPKHKRHKNTNSSWQRQNSQLWLKTFIIYHQPKVFPGFTTLPSRYKDPQYSIKLLRSILKISSAVLTNGGRQTGNVS